MLIMDINFENKTTAIMINTDDNLDMRFEYINSHLFEVRVTVSGTNEELAKATGTNKDHNIKFLSFTLTNPTSLYKKASDVFSYEYILTHSHHMVMGFFNSRVYKQHFMYNRINKLREKQDTLQKQQNQIQAKIDNLEF